MWLIRRGVSTEEGSKKGVGEMCKNFFFFFFFSYVTQSKKCCHKKSVMLRKVKNAVTKKMQITSLKNCLPTFSFLPVNFFPLVLWIQIENRTGLKKILNLNHKLKWNTSLQICKLHLSFITTMNMGRGIMLIRIFDLKVIDSKEKF